MPRLLAPVIAADPTPRWKRDRVVRYEPVVPFILPARDMRVLYALSNKHDEGFMTYPLPHAHAYFARMDALMARERSYGDERSAAILGCVGGSSLEGFNMLAEKEVATPAPSINTDPIFVAIEMSRSKWVVGTHIPTSSKVGIHTVEWGAAAALLALVERLRSRAADVVGIADVPVLCCYEAGYEGFWLYRRLAAAGLRVLVIDPSSLLVNRRAKRAKTDRIDAKAMIRALMAYNRGEDQVLSAVNIPSVEQEDHRRLVRERQSLVYDCTAHTNRIRGLLLTQGIAVGFATRAPAVLSGDLDELVTGDGRSLGPRLKDELQREIEARFALSSSS